MIKIVIGGSPRAGKSTLANALGEILGIRHEQVAHTDDLVGVLSWSDSSAEVARWLADESPHGPIVLEGTSCWRALRKWALDRPETEKPCLVVVNLTLPFVALSEGQSRMAKGCATVFAEILPDLRLRGVHISDYQDKATWHARSRAEALADVLRLLS